MGTLIMALEPVAPKNRQSFLGTFSLVAMLAAIPLSLITFTNPGPAFGGMLLIDGFATFFRLLVLIVGALTIILSRPYFEREGAESGEYYALLLFSIVGQCLMASANELIMIFLGLEISSISSYVLAGYLRKDPRNNEAALKYFLLGSFATAFFLYGIAMVYGATGSTNLVDIRQALMAGGLTTPDRLLFAAAALMFAGFAFKVGAAPFQVWVPDVYQGAPTPVAAFLSAGPKAAAFAVLLRVFFTTFIPFSDQWEPIIWVTALATMLVGNFAALVQSNIKRMLAYSSVAHAGYVLIAIATHSDIGTAAAMFYLAAYAFMNIGAFAVVAHCARKGETHTEVKDFAGLAIHQPFLAAILAFFMFSLIGIPLTGGFFGKFYIFKSAIDSQFYWLAALGLANSALAAYYYLRVVVVMYMQ
ncbi:MAG: NADH-quinone oxidoreductase subunit N, partial [Bryobacterales bacterium]|nr:NADH-quinone oxidoreductase subunit N [Bryobacterales bacterium]